MKPIVAASLLALCLSACGGPSDEDVLTRDKIRASESAPQLPDIQLSENPEPPPAPALPEQPDMNALENAEMENAMEGDELAPIAADTIPAAFQDQWGQVPDDCAPGGGAGTGLVISGNSLISADSVGRLQKVVGDYPERFVGQFDFGGQSREEQLALTGSSNVLIRVSGGQRLTYRRCSTARPTG